MSELVEYRKTLVREIIQQRKINSGGTYHSMAELPNCVIDILYANMFSLVNKTQSQTSSFRISL